MMGARARISLMASGGAVLTFQIRTAEVVLARQQMILIARGMYDDGPGSITPNVYWYKEGKLVLLPSELKDQQLNVSPPEEFVELRNALGG